MTYQEAFMRDVYAQTAVQIGHASRKSPEWMHETAWTLLRLDDERMAEKGKPMSRDHLLQTAKRLSD